MGSIWGRNVGQFVVPHVGTKCDFYAVFINVVRLVMDPITEENKYKKASFYGGKKLPDGPLLQRGKGSKLNWVERLVAAGWLATGWLAGRQLTGC